jgi:hypothetical protein
MTLKPFVGPWSLLQLLDLFTRSVGLLRRGISPSQGLYPHTQNSTKTDIHASSCLRTHDLSVFSGRRQFMSQTAQPL